MSHVDLHCHSTASDGTFRPAEVVRLAKQSGLSALSLTDHDTVAGIDEATAAAKELAIDFLPGIEISCIYPKPGMMHLLGYGVDPHGAALKDLTRRLIEGRDQRNLQIIDALQRQTISITLDEVQAAAGGEVIGRPHIAQVLMRKGYVSSIKSAFDRYLAPGGSAYFDKEVFSSREAIELIHASGGVAVLAHAVQLRCDNGAELDNQVKNLVDMGLDGIEVIHSDHAESDIEQITQLADRYGLLKTGGSDFHGSRKPGIAMGIARGHRVPRSWFEALLFRVKQ